MPSPDPRPQQRSDVYLVSSDASCAIGTGPLRAVAATLAGGPPKNWEARYWMWRARLPYYCSKRYTVGVYTFEYVTGCNVRSNTNNARACEILR